MAGKGADSQTQQMQIKARAQKRWAADAGCWLLAAGCGLWALTLCTCLSHAMRHVVVVALLLSQLPTSKSDPIRKVGWQACLSLVQPRQPTFLI